MPDAAEDQEPVLRLLADRATYGGAEVRRIEARGATVLCGHDDAQWATLRKGAHAYE